MDFWGINDCSRPVQMRGIARLFLLPHNVKLEAGNYFSDLLRIATSRGLYRHVDRLELYEVRYHTTLTVPAGFSVPSIPPGCRWVGPTFIDCLIERQRMGN
jgi:hypothetical protein